MKRAFYITALFLLVIVCTNAVAKGNLRALLIGIDKYNPKNAPGRWMNLDGCANDAQSVKQILEARYGFLKKNLTMLLDSNATRDNILNGFNDLLARSEAEDIAVIYYAGHGSQVKNTLSEEKDQKDESMVPADSYIGGKDIRDKELAAAFNKFVDKGVILTVLYDCCHSGSIGRGGVSVTPPKLRYIPEDASYDAMDASRCIPPEQRGVLIMSASQDDELASEQIDNNGNPHGAFTIALLQSLTSLPVNASATEIFLSVSAILKYNGKPQKPVLAATDGRKVKTLFGYEKGTLTGKTVAAVLSIGNDELVLQGGYAIGIYPNSELTCKNGDNVISVEVIKVDGISTCTAKLTVGDIKLVTAGDLFELKSWCLPEGAHLKVYIPPSTYTLAQLISIAQELNKRAQDKKITIVRDPVKEIPTHTVFFSEGGWYMGLPDNKVVSMGGKPDVNMIIKNLVRGSRLYVSYPPTQALALELKAKYKEDNAVDAVAVPANAQYFLTGRFVDDKLEYAYFIPQISTSDSSFSNTMPLRTNYFALGEGETAQNAIADSLAEFSLRMAKIKAWLILSGPSDDGSFPFRLAIKDATQNRFISREDEVNLGDTLGFYLEADEANLNYWDKTKKYIYVFAIDNNGKMKLYFPRSGNVENRGPALDRHGDPLSYTVLGRPRSVVVSEPAGIDTYIMLATNEPIPNPEAFDQPGVLTRGAKNGYSSLFNIGTRTRGEILTPTEWGVQKVAVRSVRK
jgi:hypothetical protein